MMLSISKNKKIALFLVVTFLFVVVLGGCGKTDPPVTTDPGEETDLATVAVKITTVQLPAQILGEGAINLGAAIQAHFAADSTVQVYTSGQLYNTGNEELEALGNGDIQFAFVTGPALEAISKDMGAMRMPYLFRNPDAAYDFIDSDFAKEKLYLPIEDKNIMILDKITTGPAMVSNSKREIVTPNDVKGLKIRIPDRIGINIFEAVGGQAITTASNETITALQQGLADGVSTQISIFYDRGFYDVQKYITDLGMLQLGMSYLAVNKTWWEGLDADVRAEFEVVFDEVMTALRTKMNSYSEEVYKDLEDKGYPVIRLTDEQLQAWKDATSSVYDTMVGEFSEGFLPVLREEAAKY